MAAHDFITEEFNAAYAQLPANLKLALQTAEMLIVPSQHITSKGAVRREHYRPPLQHKVFAMALTLESLSRELQDELILQYHNRVLENIALAKLTQPTTPTQRAANTAALLASLGLPKP